jgi:hypothetical protein
VIGASLLYERYQHSMSSALLPTSTPTTATIACHLGFSSTSRHFICYLLLRSTNLYEEQKYLGPWELDFHKYKMEDAVKKDVSLPYLSGEEKQEAAIAKLCQDCRGLLQRVLDLVSGKAQPLKRPLFLQGGGETRLESDPRFVDTAPFQTCPKTTLCRTNQGGNFEYQQILDVLRVCGFCSLSSHDSRTPSATELNSG